MFMPMTEVFITFIHTGEGEEEERNQVSSCCN